MILSHKNRFIFLKGRKVAGTSIEMALTTICGPDDIITPFGPFDEVNRYKAGGRPQNYAASRAEEAEYLEKIREAAETNTRTAAKSGPAPYGNHMSLAKLMGTMKAEFPEDYLCFAVDRHPYAKILSLANMHAAKRDKSGEFVASSGDIRAAATEIVETSEAKKLLNLKSYRAADGSLPTHVMRYETLAAEFAEVMKNLQIANPPELPHLKKGGLFEPAQVRDFLTAEQIAGVNTLFRDEFDTYGYEPVEP